VINWLSQIASLTFFNLRTIPERKGAAITAAVGIAGVVAVLVGVLSFAEGFRAAMTVSGPDDVAIVLRGADNEMTSGLHRKDPPHCRRTGVASHGRRPLSAAELFVMINLRALHRHGRERTRCAGRKAAIPVR
jgi:putative ABC transport system permease protein